VLESGSGWNRAKEKSMADPVVESVDPEEAIRYTIVSATDELIGQCHRMLRLRFRLPIGLDRRQRVADHGSCQLSRSLVCGEAMIKVHRHGSMLEASVSVGGEDRTITAVLTLLGLTLRITVPRVPRVAGDYEARTLGGYLGWPEDETSWTGWFDCLAVVYVWANGMGWSRDQLQHWPWNAEYGWTFMFRPFQWVIGAPEYETMRETVVPCVIEMPEKKYEGTLTLTVVRWNRRGWPGRQFDRISISVPEGVPHNYKWGPDATYSMGFSCEQLGTHLAFDTYCKRYAAAVQKTRDQYGFTQEEAS
jgi:hypothetical protein